MSKQLFDDLRKLAAESRDKKLAEIRSEYSQSIADIAAMEQKLIGKPIAVRPKDKRDEKLVDLIAAVMPSDRAVTNDDVCGLLRAADPERVFNAPTIRATLHRLVKEGTVKRLNNPQHGQKVRYCVPEFDAEPVRPLSDWAEQILHESGRPMQAVEIMVAMTEAGYELKCPPREAVKHLESALSRNQGQFNLKGDNWDCR